MASVEEAQCPTAVAFLDEAAEIGTGISQWMHDEAVEVGTDLIDKIVTDVKEADFEKVVQDVKDEADHVYQKALQSVAKGFCTEGKKMVHFMFEKDAGKTQADAHEIECRDDKIAVHSLVPVNHLPPTDSPAPAVPAATSPVAVAEPDPEDDDPHELEDGARHARCEAHCDSHSVKYTSHASRMKGEMTDMQVKISQNSKKFSDSVDNLPGAHTVPKLQQATVDLATNLKQLKQCDHVHASPIAAKVVNLLKDVNKFYTDAVKEGVPLMSNTLSAAVKQLRCAQLMKTLYDKYNGDCQHVSEEARSQLRTSYRSKMKKLWKRFAQDETAMVEAQEELKLQTVPDVFAEALRLHAKVRELNQEVTDLKNECERAGRAAPSWQTCAKTVLGAAAVVLALLCPAVHIAGAAHACHVIGGWMTFSAMSAGGALAVGEVRRHYNEKERAREEGAACQEVMHLFSVLMHLAKDAENKGCASKSMTMSALNNYEMAAGVRTGMDEEDQEILLQTLEIPTLTKAIAWIEKQWSQLNDFQAFLAAELYSFQD